MLRAVLLIALAGTAARAGEVGVKEVPYENINVSPGDLIDFDTQPEPVVARHYDDILTIGSVSFGEVFAGQTLREKQDRKLHVHDLLDVAAPASPLSLAVLHPGQNLTVAYAPYFGSQALFPVGPKWRVGDVDLGTGSVAMLFETDQCAFGFATLLEGEWINSYSQIWEAGILNVIFYDRSGNELGSIRRFDDLGRFRYGYEQTGTAMPKIAGVLIQNLDISGIAIDEIIFSDRCGLMLS